VLFVLIVAGVSCGDGKREFWATVDVAGNKVLVNRARDLRVFFGLRFSNWRRCKRIQVGLFRSESHHNGWSGEARSFLPRRRDYAVLERGVGVRDKHLQTRR